MLSVREAVAKHMAELEDGVPDRSPPVLIEATLDQETLVPKPDAEEQVRFMTMRMDRVDLDAFHDERTEQLMAIADVIAPDSMIFDVVKTTANPSPNICIGRAKKNDIVVIDGTISSVHAVIAENNEQHFLTDHKSKNGTFLNKKRVGPRDELLLTSGDCVRIGRRVFYYLNGDRLHLLLELLEERYSDEGIELG